MKIEKFFKRLKENSENWPPQKDWPSKKEFSQILDQYKKPAWYPIVEGRIGECLDSKFSGIPMLSSTEQWPKCGHCCNEMQLFLQLNSEQLPDELRNPFGEGFLQIFYCTSDSGNCEEKDEDEQQFPYSISSLVRVINSAEVTESRIKKHLLSMQFQRK